MKLHDWMTSGLLSATLSACLAPPAAHPLRTDPGPASPPAVVALRPSQGVPTDAMVTIVISQPVMLIGSAYPVYVTRSTGEMVAADVMLTPSGNEIDLLPRDSWPIDEVLQVQIGPGLVGKSGDALTATMSLSFETSADGALPIVPAMGVSTSTGTLVVRAPMPGIAAPLNSAFVVAEVTPPVAAQGIRRLYLVGERGQVPAEVAAVSGDGVILAALPPYRSPCDPLCPNAVYRLAADDDALQTVPGPVGQVITSSVVDRVGPTLTSSTVLVLGDQLALDLVFDKPTLLHGTLEDASGSGAPLPLPFIPAEETRVDPGTLLLPDADYAFVLEGSDIAGNAIQTLRFQVHTPPRILAAITEIVPAPTHDWSDADGSGPPYGPYPGAGAVTSADQWVELVNASNAAIDLTTSSLVLRKTDHRSSDTALGDLKKVYFGNGGSMTSWLPGEAIVLHPKGTMAKRGFVLELILGTRRLDRVGVGDVEASVSVSTTPPDSAHESLAKQAGGEWRWCVPNPGDPLPPSDCI